MATPASRDAYFETGLDVLANEGYGALKLSEVCNRLGVTTGSFYHFFKNWGAYTDALLQYWLKSRTVFEMENARAISDPFERVSLLIQVGLALPHGAESAIRTWSSVNPEVRPIQEEVDKNRYSIVYESAFELLGNAEQAQGFASWAIYILIGYEQAALPHDVSSLGWVAQQMLDSLAAQAGLHAESSLENQ